MFYSASISRIFLFPIKSSVDHFEKLAILRLKIGSELVD